MIHCRNWRHGFVEQILRDAFICGICYHPAEPFHVLVPCGHPVCKDCCDGIFAADSHRPLFCPFCRFPVACSVAVPILTPVIREFTRYACMRIGCDFAGPDHVASEHRCELPLPADHECLCRFEPPQILSATDELFVAAANDDAARIAALVGLGTDVNAYLHGCSALIHAAELGHTSAVNALAGLGADLNARRDVRHETALFAAAHEGYTAVVAALVRLGADPEMPDWLGRTPIWIAAWQGHTATVLVLAQLGADLHARDITGFPPLFAAAWKGHGATIRALQLLLAA